MLKSRILTASLLAPLIIAGILLLPEIWFALAWGIVIAVCAWEWSDLATLESTPARAGFVLAVIGAMTSYQFWAGDAEAWLAWPVAAWWVLLSVLMRAMPTTLLKLPYPVAVRMLAGFAILVTAWILMVWIHTNLGAYQTLYLFLLIWLADIGAYFGGKQWGFTKLAPEISPGKTSEGLYVAMALTALFAGSVAGSLYALESGSFIGTTAVTKAIDFVVFSIVTVYISVVGDLFESLVKRVRGVKDSGALLPGHGGMLDRVDSLVAAVSVYYAGSKLLGIYFQ